MVDTKNLLNSLIVEGEKHQAFRVSLVCNDFPSIITDTGLIQSKVINSRITDAMFSEILGAVFAHSSDFTDFQRQRRTLNIADVGSVDVFGLADLRCINIYYERGKSLFEIDLDLYFPGQSKKTPAAEKKVDEKSSDDEFSISYSDVFASNDKTAADKKLPSTGGSSALGLANAKTAHTDSTVVSSETESSSDELLRLDFGSHNSEGSKVQSQAPSLPPPPKPTAALHEDSIIADMPKKSPKLAPLGAEEEVDSIADDASADDDNEDVMNLPLESAPANVDQGSSSGFDALLREMLRLGASDLHLVSGKHQAFRINGRFEKVDNIISVEQAKAWLSSVAPKKGGKSKFLVHQLIPAQVFMHELGSGERFRVNAFKDINGINLAIRSIVPRNCDELNIPAVVRKFCGLSKGLVLVTGYASSGISSTLTALIELVNDVNRCNLLKIGNPVSEFKHVAREAVIRQIDIGKHVESTDMALTLSMHGDFDALFIDDLEVASLPCLLDCIDRGQLAFATIHTRAGTAILEQLGTSLQQANRLFTATRAVVSQVLVPSVGGALVAAFEVLIVDGAVLKLLTENKGHMLPAYMEANANKGNITLNSSLVNLIIKGKITYRSALAVATDKREFHRTAIKHGIKAAA